MSGEGGEKAAVTSYSLKVLLAAMLGGGRGEAKPVPARLLGIMGTQNNFEKRIIVMNG